MKALHKPNVCEAKHTDITNKGLQKGNGADGREKHCTHPVLARRTTLRKQIKVCKR